MLLNFAFSNFRSFKETANLSMVAGSQRSLDSILIRKKGLRVLPSAVIYGANASGKSNLIMALEIMRKIVLNGSIESTHADLFNLELYPFAYQASYTPMKFEIDFLADNYRLVYGFAIAVDTFKKNKRKIVSEELKVINKSGSLTSLFSRRENQVELAKDSKSLKLYGIELALLEKLEKRLKDNLDSMELFLTGGFKHTLNADFADIIIDYFRDKLFVFSNFPFTKTNLSFSDDSDRADNVFFWNHLLDGFVKRSDFGPQQIAFKTNDKDTSDQSTLQLVSVYEHENQTNIIPAELMESSGTLKLIDFAIPFQKIFTEGGVLILDEFDSGLHPELIKGILACFNNTEINTAGAQLIFTTHNPIYLNNRLFRRDQILFTEKNPESYESYLYSLADFGSEEVRNDHNFLLNYFKGNYGALPSVDFSTILVSDKKGKNYGEDG